MTNENNFAVAPIMTFPDCGEPQGNEWVGGVRNGQAIRYNLPMQSEFALNIPDITVLNNQESLVIRLAQANTLQIVNFMIETRIPIEGDGDINIGVLGDLAGICNIPTYVLNSSPLTNIYDDGVLKGDIFNKDITNQDILITLTGAVTAGAINIKLFRG